MPRRVALDAVYELKGPGELSGQDRFVPGLKTYTAEYRMNTGYWRMKRTFRAASDEEASATARDVIPKRKPKDVTYMIVHALWCDDDNNITEEN